MKTLHLLIAGRVQGVGYRDWMVAQAVRLEVTGWVRNRHGGGVEAVIQGADDAVGALLEACRTGPDYAYVTGITTEDMPPFKGAGFERCPTG